MKTYIKHSLIAVLTAVVASTTFARWVTQEEVRQAATTTLSQSLFKNTFPNATITSVLEMDGLWCVNLMPKGHIVFSGSTLQVPVLSFSDGAYTTPQKRSPAFTIESAQRSRAKALEAANKPDEVAEARWEALLKPVASVKMLTVVEEEEEEELPDSAELELNTHWNQCLPWNDFCPQLDAAAKATDLYRNRAPVGCAVTMYSQLLNYFQWPARLDGVYTNTLIGENCALNPEGTSEYEMRFNGALPIEWNTLDSTYDEDVSEAERLAMGRVGLLFDILSEMQFGEESGTSLLKVCTNEWYDFGNMDGRDEIANTTNEGNEFVKFTDEQLTEIKEILAEGVPIPASIPGHAVLVCGYKVENGANYLKINYGWGNLDNTNTFYEANSSELETWLIGHTPKIQVQVAPLPKVVNVNSLSVMWMVPECYEGDSETESDFSKFTVVATPYSSEDIEPSCVLSLEDPIAEVEVCEVINLKDPSGVQVPALLIKEPEDQLAKYYYNFPEAFIPTKSTTFSWNLEDLREEAMREEPVVTMVEVQLWSETARSWQTLKTFPETGEKLPEALTIELGDYAEQFCRLRLVVSVVDDEEDDEEEDDEEEEEEEESAAVMCYALYNPQVSNVYAQGTPVSSKKLGYSVRECQLKNLTASEGQGTRYRIQVKATHSDPEIRIAPAETFTRVTTDSVAFPIIESVVNLNGKHLVEDVLLKADLYGTAGLRVTCNEAVTELRAQTSCPTLIPDNAITIKPYDEHIFDVVIDSSLARENLDGSRMILWLEAKTEQGNVTTKEVVLALRAAIEWDVDEDSLEIPHYWFQEVGLVTEENAPETAADWKTLAEEDDDNDGLLNWQEYLCGTSPINAEEKLQIQGLNFDENGTLTSVSYTPMTAEKGVITLEGKASLTDETWATADLTTHRFFRLRVTKK